MSPILFCPNCKVKVCFEILMKYRFQNPPKFLHLDAKQGKFFKNGIAKFDNLAIFRGFLQSSQFLSEHYFFGCAPNVNNLACFLSKYTIILKFELKGFGEILVQS